MAHLSLFIRVELFYDVGVVILLISLMFFVVEHLLLAELLPNCPNLRSEDGFLIVLARSVVLPLVEINVNFASVEWPVGPFTALLNTAFATGTVLCDVHIFQLFCQIVDCASQSIHSHDWSNLLVFQGFCFICLVHPSQSRWLTSTIRLSPRYGSLKSSPPFFHRLLVWVSIKNFPLWVFPVVTYDITKGAFFADRISLQLPTLWIFHQTAFPILRLLYDDSVSIASKATTLTMDGSNDIAISKVILHRHFTQLEAWSCFQNLCKTILYIVKWIIS